MTANVITYRGRSAAREVGKVLSIEPAQIDTLAKVMNHFEFVDPKDTIARDLQAAGLDAMHPTMRLFGGLWEQIQDLPRHLGQHSGGMVICQGRLDEIVPLENASMPDRVVIQWDKDDCADMGIVKVDLLGLGMMSVLQDALEVVTGVDLAHLPPNDPAVYRMLQEADTIGIFQVESRAQMATLPRLKPQNFYDIVVEVAIIRPGPIVGQMVHPYLTRRKGDEPVVYPHPSLQPILERTLGVPLFQEQLLRMAMVAAGFTGGEAEELRRAFGFKRSEKRMQQIEGKLRAGMERQGITGGAAEEIIRSITSFALYGFPESHAASFALLVYASAYLKAHYPAAFYTALLNNQPMGFYHPSTIVKDAQRHGVRFAPIDVQISDWPCRVEGDGRVRLGLMYVNGLRREAGQAIADCRLAVADCIVDSRLPIDGMPIEDCLERCPKCGCDDPSMLETLDTHEGFCNVCSHLWTLPIANRHSVDRQSSIVNSIANRHSVDRQSSIVDSIANRQSAIGNRFATLDQLIRRCGLRRDEVATLAEIGALNAFGFDRRTALWQIEQAVRPAGDLFADAGAGNSQLPTSNLQPPASSPLRPMTVAERLLADYAGTSLTIGPHPMSLRRSELALRGVLRASDLPSGRHGRRVRVAGAVITRQRPGTAKGFVFLTLEDETGIANIIVRPDLYSEQRATIVGEPYLLVEGTLQIQEGVTSVKAHRLHSLGGGSPAVESHDFR
jgi:error-prone DNA polymerase